MQPLQFVRDLRAVGEPTSALHRAARRGESHRLRRGAYVPTAHWQGSEDRERHLMRVLAVARTFPSRPVFSHESAAAIWGLPLIGRWPDRVAISFDGAYGMSTRQGVRAARATFGPGDVVERGGLRLTSPGRTALDLARTSPLATGVCVLDHAIRAGQLAPDAAARLVAEHRPFPGVRRLEVAASIACGLSESPLESLSMARFLEFGVPLPAQQLELVGASGSRYRVDFYWEQLGLIGESDGAQKYASRDDLVREKRREDDLRAAHPRFLRWTWAEAWSGLPLLGRLEHAGLRAGRLHL